MKQVALRALMVCHMALRQLNCAKDGDGLDPAILMVGNQWGFARMGLIAVDCVDCHRQPCRLVTPWALNARREMKHASVLD